MTGVSNTCHTLKLTREGIVDSFTFAPHAADQASAKGLKGEEDTIVFVPWPSWPWTWKSWMAVGAILAMAAFVASVITWYFTKDPIPTNYQLR